MKIHPKLQLVSCFDCAVQILKFPYTEQKKKNKTLARVSGFERRNVVPENRFYLETSVIQPYNYQWSKLKKASSHCRPWIPRRPCKIDNK